MKSSDTRRAYASDWKHFASWCRRQGISSFPPGPEVVANYLMACATGFAGTGSKPNKTATIKRRLAALIWNYGQRGEQLDRDDLRIRQTLIHISREQTRQETRKLAILPGELLAMVATLDRGTLRGLRDRAMLLLAYAADLRRSEVVGIDLGEGSVSHTRGLIELSAEGLRITLHRKAGSRMVEIARSADGNCPVGAVEAWVRFARITDGPLFRRVRARGKEVAPERLKDQEVARLVKRTAIAAGLRSNLTKDERASAFSGRSLRNLSAGHDSETGS